MIGCVFLIFFVVLFGKTSLLQKMKKKEQSTGVEDLSKELSRLKKENTVLVCKLDQTKSDKKVLQKELRKERKKKSVTTITLSEEQEQLLSTLLPDIDIRNLL